FRRAGFAAHAHPCLDEGAHQPRPYGSLMGRGVAPAAIAAVVRSVAGLAGRERAQPDGCQQSLLDRIDDAARVRSFYDRKRQAADREDLIGPERAVEFSYDMIAVDYVIEAPTGFIPEARHEREFPASIQQLPLVVGLARDLERVEPQRLDLDRLADARRHHPVADFRIHPGELHAGLAGCDESVVVAMNPVARAVQVALEDRIH